MAAVASSQAVARINKRLRVLDNFHVPSQADCRRSSASLVLSFRSGPSHFGRTHLFVIPLKPESGPERGS